MLDSSDGRSFVYGFFVADGAECCDLQSLHHDEEGANAAREAWKLSDRFWPSDILEVHCLEVAASPRVHQEPQEK